MMRRSSATSPSASARIKMAARPAANRGSNIETEERPLLSVVEKVEADWKLLPSSFTVMLAFAAGSLPSVVARVT